jgi:uncharacterized membrane protein
LGGAFSQTASGINDAGQIVGSYRNSFFASAFSKTARPLPGIDVPGTTRTGASGINDAGQIVGKLLRFATGNRGFLKDGATFTTIDVPGSTNTFRPGNQ